jgi:hypothetical protein
VDSRCPERLAGKGSADRWLSATCPNAARGAATDKRLKNECGRPAPHNSRRVLMGFSRLPRAIDQQPKYGAAGKYRRRYLNNVGRPFHGAARGHR